VTTAEKKSLLPLDLLSQWIISPFGAAGDLSVRLHTNDVPQATNLPSTYFIEPTFEGYQPLSGAIWSVKCSPLPDAYLAISGLLTWVTEGNSEQPPIKGWHALLVQNGLSNVVGVGRFSRELQASTVGDRISCFAVLRVNSWEIS
jgi:hypothetical protein